MARSMLQFYLRPDTSNYYQDTTAGVVITATAVPLSYAPMQWKDTDLQWKRSPKYAGIFRSFVVPISFVKDGLSILRHVRYTQGIEGKCLLEIRRLNQDTQLYDTYYVGDVDFSQSSDNEYFFQVTIMDGGLAAIIKAYDMTPQKVSLYASDAKLINMDGLTFQNTYSYGTLIPTGQAAQSTQIIGLSSANFRSAWDTYALPPDGDIATGTALGSVSMDMDGAGGVAARGSIPNNNYFYLADKGSTVKVILNQQLQLRNPNLLSGRSIKLSFWALHWSDATGNTVISKQLWADPLSWLTIGGTRTYGSTNPAKGTVAFTGVAKKDKIFIFYVVDSLTPSPNNWAYELDLYDGEPITDSVQVQTYYRLPASKPRSLTILQFWQKIIAQVAGSGTYTAVSTFLSNPVYQTIDSNPSNVKITCGDALRELYQDARGNVSDPAIKTSIDDFHSAMRAVYMAGIGVEGNVARLEHLSYFFDNSTVSASLGLVKNLRRDTPHEFLFNQIKAGFERQSYDAVNGKDEFNTDQFYTTPGIRAPKQIDMQSHYRADMYGIEFTRYNLSGKKTTDSESDNDIFLVETKPVIGSSGAYDLARPQNDFGNSATGVIDPTTAFNLSLSPKRNLLRNSPLISVATHLMSGALKFRTSDKNEYLVSKLSNSVGILAENADVPITSLGDPLFLPILFVFETEVPTDIAALIEANPYGRIEFKWRNKKTGELIDQAGFIYEVGIHPADNAVYTWKLLACPDTDLSKLK